MAEADFLGFPMISHWSILLLKGLPKHLDWRPQQERNSACGRPK